MTEIYNFKYYTTCSLLFNQEHCFPSAWTKLRGLKYNNTYYKLESGAGGEAEEKQSDQGKNNWTEKQENVSYGIGFKGQKIEASIIV